MTLLARGAPAIGHARHDRALQCRGDRINADARVQCKILCRINSARRMVYLAEDMPLPAGRHLQRQGTERVTLVL